MDLSSWINSNLTCKVKPTRKKYYQRYLYRVKIYAPFGRLLHRKYTETPNHSLWAQVDSDVSERKDHLRQQIHTYYSSYWSARVMRDMDECDVDQLEYLYRKIGALKERIKLRVEEPYVEIYAESEDIVMDIVAQMPKRSSRVIEVHMPASAAEREALDRGEIFMPGITDYDFQVNLRTILLSTSKRGQIHDYLAGLGDLVKMTPGMVDTLTRPKYTHSDNMWIYQCYFYTNDTSLCTFLNLIEPQLVHKILKIAKLPTK